VFGPFAVIKERLPHCSRGKQRHLILRLAASARSFVSMFPYRGNAEVVRSIFENQDRSLVIGDHRVHFRDSAVFLSGDHPLCPQ